MPALNLLKTAVFGYKDFPGVLYIYLLCVNLGGSANLKLLEF